MRPDYKKIYSYILEAIDPEAYGETAETEQEKLAFFMTHFRNEYDFSIERYGEHKALSVYLSGLPSTINIAFMNCDIINIAQEWGSLPENPTEKQEDKILENYFEFMACQIMKLARKYKAI